MTGTIQRVGLAFALVALVFAAGCATPQSAAPAAPPPASAPGAGAPPAAYSQEGTTQGTPRLETGTLEQATEATGIRVAAPDWLPEGTRVETVRWSVKPPGVYQEFKLPDGRWLVFGAGPIGGPDVPQGTHVTGQGVEGFLTYTAPEAGDTVSTGTTTLRWTSDGKDCLLNLEGPPDEALLVAVADSVPRTPPLP